MIVELLRSKSQVGGVSPRGSLGGIDSRLGTVAIDRWNSGLASSTMRFPVDISAATAMGVADWFESFLWPVRLVAYRQVECDVKDAIRSTIRDLAGTPLQDLMIANYKLFFVYSNLISALLVTRELRDKGLTPVALSSPMVGGILKDGLPSRRLLPVPSHILQEGRDPLGIRSRLRAFRWAAIYSTGSVARLSALSGLASHHALFPLNPLGKEYLSRKTPRSVSAISLRGWFGRAQLEPALPGTSRAVKELVSALTEDICRIAERHGVRLNGEQQRYLNDVAAELLLESSQYLRSIEREMARVPFLYLYLGSSGGLIQRLVAIGARRTEKHVTSFQHGEPLVYDWDKLLWLEYPIADVHMFYTDAAARVARTHQSTSREIGNSRAELHGAESHMFRDLRASAGPVSGHRRIKTVMLVSVAYTWDDKIGQGISIPELVQLHLELSVIDALESAGVEVVYRPHPEGKFEEVHPLFVRRVRIEKRRFDDANFDVDAFVFYHTRTTAIGPALCSNKPIIFIDLNEEVLVPEMQGAFQNRCRMVRGCWDESMRVELNADDLRCALELPLEEPDLSLVESFLLPAG